MQGFLSLVEYTVALSVLAAAASNYLIINKLWIRRDNQDVAESVSIGAALLGLATGVPFFIQFVMIDQTLWPAVKTGIGIITGVVFVLIGSGLWVHENRGVGFFRLFYRALRLEKTESGDLIKSLVQPKGADRILEVLQRMAHIDRHVHEKEIGMIRDFAERWHMEMPDLDEGEVGDDGGIFEVRDAVERYLDVHPPHEQAGELVDLLTLFIEIDEQVTAEEEMVLDEIRGVIARYIEGEGAAKPLHEVVIVPQDSEQFEAVKALLPGAEMKAARGGRVFSVGHFFAPTYAEQVCQKYIALGLFTTHVRLDEVVAEPQAA